MNTDGHEFWSLGIPVIIVSIFCMHRLVLFLKLPNVYVFLYCIVEFCLTMWLIPLFSATKMIPWQTLSQDFAFVNCCSNCLYWRAQALVDCLSQLYTPGFLENEAI